MNNDINIAIRNKFWTRELEKSLFEDMNGDCAPVNGIMESSAFTWLNVLVTAGVFTSTSQARKAGHSPHFKAGFSDGYYGKLRRRITIWNPIEEKGACSKVK